VTSPGGRSAPWQSPWPWSASRRDRDHTDTLIGALGELRRALGGQKATLVWGGLPAHPSRSMRAGCADSGAGWWWSRWLPTPPSATVEALWASRKGVELANLAGESLEEVGAAAERGIQRIRGTTTWPTRSFGTAACRYGERQPCRRNANLLRVKRK
jgi:hypothetical protein